MKTKNELYVSEDCVKDSYKQNYTGKIMVLKPSFLKEEYRKPQFQLFKAESGFGCDPAKTGRAVFGKYLIDGEKSRCDRSDFIGILKDELVKELELEE